MSMEHTKNGKDVVMEDFDDILETLEGEEVGDIVSNQSSHDRGNVNLRWYDIERMPEF